jgi:tRNA modification GTPase
MFSPADTIVAIATPPGRGGIGVVRVSGAAARDVAGAILSAPARLAPRHATLTRVVTAANGERGTADGGRPTAHGPRPRVFVDRTVATYFPGPASYTGEDVVEISAHGSQVVLGQIVAAAMAAGARLAEPGEFTFRAFLNGRIDLVQAEAVADLIDAVTPRQARAAFDQLEGTLTREIGALDAALFDMVARLEASLDFPEEGYHFVEPGAAAAGLGALETRLAALIAEARQGRLVREGAQVVIAGKPNVGKSSLFNALVGTSRAIVSPAPGTTRDMITEVADVEGLRLTLVDTAGERAWHEAVDEVEQAGVERARGARSVADLVVVVLDRSQPLDAIDHRILAETSGVSRVIVASKTDLAEAWCADAIAPVVPVSVRTGDGLEALRPAIARALGAGAGTARDTAAVTNVRHAALLERARVAVGRARAAVDASRGTLPEEFVLADLQDARAALEEITGARRTEDLLAHIFSRFCIGK